MASRRKRRVRQLRRMLVLCAMLSVVIYAGAIFFKHYKQYHELCQQEKEMATQLEELKNESEQLKVDIAFTQTNEYVERKARELLGWVKPGEVKYVEKASE